MESRPGTLRDGYRSQCRLLFKIYVQKRPYSNAQKRRSQSRIWINVKGIGAAYLTPQMVAWHKADLENRMFVNIEGGKKASMPRYFKERLYNKGERATIGEKMAKLRQKEIDEQMKVEGDLYYRNKFQNDAAAFEQMKRSADKNNIL